MSGGLKYFLISTSAVVLLQIYNALISPAFPPGSKSRGEDSTQDLNKRSFLSLSDVDLKRLDTSTVKPSSSVVSFGLYQIDEDDEEEEYSVQYSNTNEQTAQTSTASITRNNSSGQFMSGHRQWKKVTRNESEMSLGLNRNSSFANHAMALGEFCKSGQIFIAIARYTLIVAATSTILYYQFTSESTDPPKKEDVIPIAL